MSQSESIRDGLVANMQPLLAANGGPIGQISPYELSSAAPPCIFVTGGEIVYDEAMQRGLDELTFTVICLVAENLDVPAQQLLDSLRAARGSTSVKTAIETDRTLAGVVSDLRVTRASQPRPYASQQSPVRLGCEWTVQVLAPPS